MISLVTQLVNILDIFRERHNNSVHLASLLLTLTIAPSAGFAVKSQYHLQDQVEQILHV